MSNLITSLPGYSGLNPILDVESSTTNSTYTLPTGANIQAGQRVKVANNAANSGNFPIVSVNANDGTLVRQVYPQTDAEFVALQANPTTQSHWLALGKVTSNWIDISTLNWSLKGSSNAVVFTNSTLYVAKYKRDGDTAYFQLIYNFTGAPGGGTGQLSFLVPTMFQVDPVKMPGSNQQPMGSAYVNNGSTTSDACIVYYGNQTFLTTGQFNVYVAAGIGANTVAGLTATSPVTIGNNGWIGLEFFMPILGWSETRG